MIIYKIVNITIIYFNPDTTSAGARSKRPQQ